MTSRSHARNPWRAPLRIDLGGWSREATLGEPRAFFAFFEQAERLGFDGVWFHEFRLLRESGPYPAPLLLAAALLARTERLRVGISALVLPLHHPLLLAEELAQLDLQSAGRLDVGLGRGTDPQTLRALQLDPAATRERFEQGVRLLRSALRGEVVSSTDGPWRFEAIEAGPRCVQQPHPPIYIAGSSRETMAFAVEQDLPLLLSLEPPETAQLTHVDAVFARQPDAVRRDALLSRSSLSRYVCAGRTRADAEAQVQRLLPLLYGRRVYFAQRRGLTPEQVPPTDGARALRDQFICGDPSECIAQVGDLVARTGVRQLRCVFNGNGVLDREEARANMTFFAGEVLPALRDADVWR